MKVQVVNLRKLVEDGTKGNYSPRASQVAILTNPANGKVIITDDDACHEIFDEKYYIELYAQTKDETGVKSFEIIPSKAATLSLEELQEYIEREDELTNFIRRFGSRIEENYSILLKTIKQIGLDPADFPRSRKQARAREETQAVVI